MYRIAKNVSGYVVQYNFTPSKPVWIDLCSPKTTEAEARSFAELHWAARNCAVLVQASVPVVTV